jgi:hypothetical protein
MLSSDSENVISTWVLLDDERSASTFPQAGRASSADKSVHMIYLRCVAVFFAVARRTAGPDYTLRLYTGSELGLASADPFIAESLRASRVEIHIVPLKHLPPVGFYGRFRNQFYIFDILRAIAAEGTQGRHLILDSDCLCLRSLHEMFQAVQVNSALTLSMTYAPEHDINGLNRVQMRDLFAEMSGVSDQPLPLYSGGEFYASTSDFIRTMMPLAAVAWDDGLERFQAGKPKLNEEAHLLTYLYGRLGVQDGTGNRFIKRLWTGIHFRNGTAEDAKLPIVHLPNEKRFGFVTLYKLIQNRDSWFYQDAVDEQWVQRIQAIASVPRPSLKNMVRELAFHASRRIAVLTRKATLRFAN